MSWAQLQARTNARALRRFGADTPAVLGWQDVTGVFVEPGDEVFLGGVSAIASTPMYVMGTTDIPDAVTGMPLCILPTGQDARNFTVAKAIPDGFGFTALQLQKAFV